MTLDSTTPTRERPVPPTLALALSTGALVAIADAFAALLECGWTAPQGTEWLGLAIVSGVVAAVVFFLASIVLRVLTSATRIPPLALQLALAAAFVGMLAPSLVGGALSSPLHPFDVPRALVGAAIGAVIGYAIGARVALRADADELVGAWSLVLPLCATFALGTFWWLRFDLQPRKLGLACGGLALLVACASIAFVLVRARDRVWAEPWLALLFVAAALGAFFAREKPAHVSRARAASEKTPAHVILICVDTWRADAWSFASPSPTPNIDAFAHDSLVYTQARSAAPWTLPAMASMLTGVDADIHGAIREDIAVPARLETLAERMSSAGYRTGALGRNGMLLPHTRLDQGFDEYRFDAPLHGVPPLGAELRERFGPRRSSNFPSDLALANAGARWLDAHRDEAFFLWLHCFDPHAPYEPPKEFWPSGDPPRRIGRAFSDMAGVRSGHLALDQRERAWIRALYEAEVRELDASLGVLFANLRERDLYDDALIVLTADHGEELWEHGGYEHGHSVFDEVLRVPLMVKFPGNAHAGRDERVASTARLTPSVLASCGVPFDAASFSGPPLFTAEGAAGEPENVPMMLSTGALYFEDQSAMFRDHHKYVWHEVSAREEVYDLAQDALERHDLVDREPELLRTLRDAFDARRKAGIEMRKRLGLGDAEHAQLDLDVLRNLRALGYVK